MERIVPDLPVTFTGILDTVSAGHLPDSILLRDGAFHWRKRSPVISFAMAAVAAAMWDFTLETGRSFTRLIQKKAVS